MIGHDREVSLLGQSTQAAEFGRRHGRVDNGNIAAAISGKDLRLAERHDRNAAHGAAGGELFAPASGNNGLKPGAEVSLKPAEKKCAPC